MTSTPAGWNPTDLPGQIIDEGWSGRIVDTGSGAGLFNSNTNYNVVGVDPLSGTTAPIGTDVGFGAAVRRWVQAGVYNGDFTVPPRALGSPVNDEYNNLPYWSFQPTQSACVLAYVENRSEAAFYPSAFYTSAFQATAAVDGPTATQLRFQLVSGGYIGDDAYLTQLVPVTTTADGVYEMQAGLSILKVMDTDPDAKIYISIAFLMSNLNASLSTPGTTTVEASVATNATATIRTAPVTIPDDAMYARIKVGLKRGAGIETSTASVVVSEVFVEQRETYEGTAFPASPYTRMRFYRTDLRGGLWFRWNGTYWLSEQEYTQGVSREDNLAATGVLVRVPIPQDLDIYLTRVDSAYYFSANDGSNKWVIETRYINSGGSATTLTSDDTTSRASAGAGWKKWNDTYTTLISGAFAWEPNATQTGIPTLYGGMLMTYRLRAT